MADVLRRGVRPWRVATGLLLAAGSLRCSLLIESGGLAEGEVAGDAASAGSDAGDATSDASGPRDAAAADAPVARDAASVPDAAKVWNGNGHAYLVVVHGSGVAWETAKQEAAALGGHLATIGSEEENSFVSGLANSIEGAWAGGGAGGPYLGGFQPPGSLEPSGGWSWVTGEPWTYTAWAPAEPNGGTVEDYVQFEIRFSARWNDVGGGSPNSFVVEFE